MNTESNIPPTSSHPNVAAGILGPAGMIALSSSCLRAPLSWPLAGSTGNGLGSFYGSISWVRQSSAQSRSPPLLRPSQSAENYG